MALDYSSMRALGDMLTEEAEEEDATQNMTPASILGGMAPLNPNFAPASGGKDDKGGEDPNFETVLRNPAAEKEVDDKAIWTEEDVKLELDDNDDGDGRPSPEFEIMYKQKITTGDVYLGMSMKDASSQSCEEMTIVIELPDTKFKDVSLDVTRNRLLCRSPKWKLLLDLPHPCNSDDGTAKFDSDKSQLRVTVPIIQDED